MTGPSDRGGEGKLGVDLNHVEAAGAPPPQVPRPDDQGAPVRVVGLNEAEAEGSAACPEAWIGVEPWPGQASVARFVETLDTIDLASDQNCHESHGVEQAGSEGVVDSALKPSVAAEGSGALYKKNRWDSPVDMEVEPAVNGCGSGSETELEEEFGNEEVYDGRRGGGGRQAAGNAVTQQSGRTRELVGGGRKTRTAAAGSQSSSSSPAAEAAARAGCTDLRGSSAGGSSSSSSAQDERTQVVTQTQSPASGGFLEAGDVSLSPGEADENSDAEMLAGAGGAQSRLPYRGSAPAPTTRAARAGIRRRDRPFPDRPVSVAQCSLQGLPASHMGPAKRPLNSPPPSPPDGPAGSCDLTGMDESATSPGSAASGRGHPGEGDESRVGLGREDPGTPVEDVALLPSPRAKDASPERDGEQESRSPQRGSPRSVSSGATEADEDQGDAAPSNSLDASSQMGSSQPEPASCEPQEPAPIRVGAAPPETIVAPIESVEVIKSSTNEALPSGQPCAEGQEGPNLNFRIRVSVDMEDSSDADWKESSNAGKGKGAGGGSDPEPGTDEDAPCILMLDSTKGHRSQEVFRTVRRRVSHTVP